MGRDYHGIDIRPEQIQANRKMYPALDLWLVGDALKIRMKRKADLVLTCPPYHDLERYSDLPDDLSTLDWGTFRGRHMEAIYRAAWSVAPGGFVAWVVGDFRGPDGVLRRFPDVVAGQMEQAGLEVWNRHIVRTPLVTAPMRWRRAWEVSQKMTMTHSEVIVGRAL